MRLANDLYDSYGRTLIGANNELTETYIQKLRNYGFDGVYISDELSEGINVPAVISPQLRSQGMECIRVCNIDGCQSVAQQMVQEIMNNGKLSLDMADLRTYDDYTYAHSVNVAMVSGLIGMGMNMDIEDLTSLVTAALLHDLGKLSIPPEILNKPERLTPDEYEIMKSHTVRSYELLSERWDISSQVRTAVLYHHENVDGSGYPNGLTGEEQTLFTKILHVADVYDALISKRPYKKPYSPYEATEYLMGGCGIMFDQHVVDVLLNYVPLHPKGTTVLLSDGRKGIIYENSGIHNLRPILRMMDGSYLDLTEPKHLSLAILPNAEEQYEELQKAEESRQKMITPVKKYHIVAVDDMKTNLQMLRGILEDLYQVTLLKSGAQALSYLVKNDYPDLILMDIDMPEMNGIEAAKRIQNLTHKSVPILFVTALCDKKTVMVCRDMNVAGYIVRPYKPVYIKAEIKRILTGRSEAE
jgi:HD-GYP domain-containing protein (c-di-GMP phosphodiesterase class II)/CheY-like chemotaxis protein